MSKTHSSLSPNTNILLIVAEAAFLGFFLFIIEPHVPLIIAAFGAVLGVAAGVMQHLSIREASSSFLGTSTLMDVRRALKATTWGSRSIYWIYFTKIALAALSLGVIHNGLLNMLFGYLAGYISFMLVRELITLRDTYFLSRLMANEVKSDAGAA
jgi:hypothetical protein